MPDAVYPMMRPARRRRRYRPMVRIRPRVIAAVVLALVVAASIWLATRPRAENDPQRAYTAAETAIARGNYSAARNHGLDAVRLQPTSPATHLVLARAYLLLGNGLEADAELDRAAATGAIAAKLQAYRAQAAFLQGDPDEALADAAKASVADPLAIRIRARSLAARGNVAAATTLLADHVSRAPRDAAALVDLGRIRFAAGEMAAAADAAGRAARLVPGDPIALTLQGEVVRARYGLVAALPWFEAALKRDAYYHPALIEYAATLGDAGRSTDMLAVTRRALAARPGSPQALYLQATMAMRAGKPDLARGLLQRAGPVADLPGALLMAGGIDAVGGKAQQAIGTWRRLADAQPMNVDARRLLAAAMLRAGDARGALDALRPLVLRGDADAYALTLAARAFEASGDRTTAALYLDRAQFGRRAMPSSFAGDAGVAAMLAGAVGAPGDPTYQLGVIRAQLDAGDTSGAIARARDLVAAGPGAAAAQLALGDTLAAGGRFAEAIGPWSRAADLAFDQPTMLRLVDAFGRTARPRDAAATLALYLQQNPQSLTARRLLGHWQVASGDMDAGIETLEGVRRAAGNRDAAVLADLALAYAATDDGDIARAYAKAAYAIAPMNPAVCDAYGVALAADGDIRSARQLLLKARALAPGDATIEEHLRRLG